MNIRGLYTHADQLSEVPAGALNVAENIVIDRESLAESRRGFVADTNPISTTEIISSTTSYQDYIIYHTTNDKLYKKVPGSAETQFTTTFNPPSASGIGSKVRFREAKRKLYFTTDDGVRKIEGVTSSDHTSSGVPKALDGSVATSGTSGFMPNDSAVAYRVVWGIEDPYKFLLLGAPSQRLVVTNSTGGTRDVDVTITIPDEITTAHFFQVYRSAPSATAADSPNDELQLVYEANPTSGEITAQEVTFTDNLPEDLKRATLYTSPSQEGISQANEVPPFAKDMDVYKGHLVFANCRRYHSASFTLIAVGSSGLVADDTISFGGITFTAKASPATETQFQIVTSGTAAQNIDATARNLVNTINKHSTSTIKAYYTSGFNDLPGQITLQESTFTETAFTVTSSRDAWDPSTIAGSGLVSTNDDKQNRIYISKKDIPDAVPTANYFDVGSSDKPIQRILALRESLYILKDDGIYRMVGETINNFRIILTDNTTTLVGPETAVVHNNQIIMMSDQGVVAVSENGDIAILSRPIEKTLLRLTALSNFESKSLAVSYESDRKYILWTIDTSNNPTTAYVYNMVTRSWTTWKYKHYDLTAGEATNYWINAGLVYPTNDKLYTFAMKNDSSNNILLQERKSFDLSDYAEDQTSVTINSIISTSEVELSVSFAGQNLLVGCTLIQGNLRRKITGVSTYGGHTTLILERKDNWSTGSATILFPTPTTVQWVPVHAGDPSLMKLWRDLVLVFDDASFSEVNVVFASDFGNGGGPVAIQSSPVGIGWGAPAWGGETPWGGEVEEIGKQTIRTFPPRETARSHWITIQINGSEARTRFGLSGFGFNYTPISSKVRGQH